jgi:AraC family transcriptional activator of pobA
LLNAVFLHKIGFSEHASLGGEYVGIPGGCMKKPVPTYGLYGEDNVERPEFWIHAETISSRSQLYNWEIKQHRHERFFQILHIRSGEGDARFASERHRLDPRTVVLMPEKIGHGYRFSHGIDGQVITLLSARLPRNFRPGQRAAAFLSSPRILSLPSEDADAD